jgi:hypothetical protein
MPPVPKVQSISNPRAFWRQDNLLPAATFSEARESQAIGSEPLTVITVRSDSHGRYQVGKARRKTYQLEDPRARQEVDQRDLAKTVVIRY